jgi:hypothetical protein
MLEVAFLSRNLLAPYVCSYLRGGGGPWYDGGEPASPPLSPGEGG